MTISLRTKKSRIIGVVRPTFKHAARLRNQVEANCRHANYHAALVHAIIGNIEVPIQRQIFNDYILFDIGDNIQ